jgi:hypothetical protein
MIVYSYCLYLGRHLLCVGTLHLWKCKETGWTFTMDTWKKETVEFGGVMNGMWEEPTRGWEQGGSRDSREEWKGWLSSTWIRRWKALGDFTAVGGDYS